MQTEVEIQRVGQLGQGIGYDPAGNIYFVPGSLPGDLVAIEYPETVKKYRDAELVSIVRPSPERKDPECQFFQSCGGCDFLQWDYEAQVRSKELMLRHLLERAELYPHAWLPMVRAQNTTGYRTRIQLRRQGGKVGFLRRKSHDIVAIDKCLVAHPELNRELSILRQEAGPSASEPMQKIELFLDDEGKVGRLYDSPHGAGGFTQINVEQNAKLKAIVARHVTESSGKRVLELFCGNGNFTFEYFPFVKHIIAVDSNDPALEAARRHRDSIDPEKPSRAAFVTSTVDKGLVRKLPPDFKGQYDTLVLDPPRSGIGPALGTFIHPKLKTVIYVSCSPGTFAQDVRVLKKEFRLAEVQGIDMFPHTRHIELVAKFERC